MPEGPAAKSHVLVVEDNPSDVYLLRLAFDRAGVDCEMTVLQDGAAAMAYIEQTEHDAARPALVIVDVNLPRRSGMDVLTALRAHPVFAPVAVAILSSSSSPRERAAIQQHENLRYFTKPPTLDEFLELGPALAKLFNS